MLVCFHVWVQQSSWQSEKRTVESPVHISVNDDDLSGNENTA